MEDLTKDCAEIAHHRQTIAPQVIATQQENVALLQEVRSVNKWNKAGCSQF